MNVQCIIPRDEACSDFFSSMKDRGNCNQESKKGPFLFVLLIFGCAGSWLLRGLFSSCSE